GKEAPPQFDHVRKLEVVPVNPAIVEPLEARVQSGADLHHGALRMPPQKVPHPYVEHGAPQATTRHPPPLSELAEIPIDRIYHLDRLGVFQNWLLPPAL